MAVGVCAHDDESGPDRAGLCKQAWSGRLIGRKACRGDAMPAQVAQRLLGIGVMLALGRGKYLDAAPPRATRMRSLSRPNRAMTSLSYPRTSRHWVEGPCAAIPESRSGSLHCTCHASK